MKNDETERNEFGMPNIRVAEGASFSGRFYKYVNQPLPWVVILTTIAISAIWIANDAKNIAELRGSVAEAKAQAAIDLANARAEIAGAKAQAATDTARIAEREARMEQYYLIEVDGKIIKLGVQLPDGGYMKFREKRLQEGVK